jgi:hypothetical protein
MERSEELDAPEDAEPDRVQADEVSFASHSLSDTILILLRGLSKRALTFPSLRATQRQPGTPTRRATKKARVSSSSSSPVATTSWTDLREHPQSSCEIERAWERPKRGEEKR